MKQIKPYFPVYTYTYMSYGGFIIKPEHELGVMCRLVTRHKTAHYVTRCLLQFNSLPTSTPDTQKQDF